jgi:hypothetical protein
LPVLCLLFGAERLLRSGEDKIIFCGCWSEPNVGPLFSLDSLWIIFLDNIFGTC